MEECIRETELPIVFGALPGLAADMHFKDEVIAFIGPACAFALEPVARRRVLEHAHHHRNGRPGRYREIISI
ncbi:hypothetical protein EVAR_77315_1 [Eumeta japonica]|uniref:Uncharacterized protein n=1 Tax=Eumeta variegata TaxID=151549 RepID=A0A4C1UM94_EUMVA|nr:hypothetical protein EVAR_77315_1 [Eumeta japonica]